MRMTRLNVLMATALLVAGCGDDSSDDSSPTPQIDAGTDVVQGDVEVDTQGEDADAGGIDAPDDAPGEDAADGSTIETQCDAAPRTFWVYDLSVMPPKYVERPFQCRAAGENVRIWVSDEIWDVSVFEQEVHDVAIAMDYSTPADPDAGIYDIATSVFGTPTSVDGDTVIDLVYDDLGQYQGTGFDGYIRAEDMLGGSYSNEAEVLYLDGVRNEIADEYMLGVISHELQHMIHLNYDLDEEGWLDETLAEASMVAAGYYGDLHTWVALDFAKNPEQSLTVAPPSFNYGAGFLFGAYLLQRFDKTFLTALVAEPLNGMAALDSVLAGEGVTRRALFADWAVANYLDAPLVSNGDYGYEAFEVPALEVDAMSLPAAETTGAVAAHAARYYLFDTSALGNDSVEVTLTTAGYADLEVRTVTFESGDHSSAEVGSVSLTTGSDKAVLAGVGGAVDRALVIVVNPTASSISVSVSAAVL